MITVTVLAHKSPPRDRFGFIYSLTFRAYKLLLFHSFFITPRGADSATGRAQKNRLAFVGWCVTGANFVFEPDELNFCHVWAFEKVEREDSARMLSTLMWRKHVTVTRTQVHAPLTRRFTIRVDSVPRSQLVCESFCES